LNGGGDPGIDVFSGIVGDESESFIDADASLLSADDSCALGNAYL
jgi:hypothetical protein